MPDIDELHSLVLERLGHEFADRGLLEQAVTHKSFANEHRDAGGDNQRLEFLGDAVLGLVVAEALMARLPQAAEGDLTPRRAALVNETSLAGLARELGLGDQLRLGRGEELNNGRTRASILADAVEALVGAVYLDGGYEAARRVIARWYGDELEQVASGSAPGDAKTALQERLQSREAGTPAYRVVGEHGPDHAKEFEVEIILDGRVLGRGRGRSKKEAEKDAARQALADMEEP